MKEDTELDTAIERLNGQRSRLSIIFVPLCILLTGTVIGFWLGAIAVHNANREIVEGLKVEKIKLENQAKDLEAELVERNKQLQWVEGLLVQAQQGRRPMVVTDTKMWWVDRVLDIPDMPLIEENQ